MKLDFCDWCQSVIAPGEINHPSCQIAQLTDEVRRLKDNATAADANLLAANQYALVLRGELNGAQANLVEQINKRVEAEVLLMAADSFRFEGPRGTFVASLCSPFFEQGTWGVTKAGKGEWYAGGLTRDEAVEEAKKRAG